MRRGIAPAFCGMVAWRAAFADLPKAVRTYLIHHGKSTK
jgi:hypothetical protein